jgi:LacI family transcriptional regulator
MIQSRLDGVLACFIEEPSTAEAIARLERSTIPFITLDTCPPGYQGAAVLNDLREAGRLAARHLVEIGCKRPAFVSAEAEHAGFSSFVALLAGFRKGLHELDATLPASRIIPGGQSLAAGTEAFVRIRAVDEAIDGVFCINAACALGVMEGADRAGVAVGRELAIVSMDDLEACGLSRISLTSVRQPYGSLAAVAVDRLVEAIARGAAPSGKQMLPPELIVRGSTRRV